MWRHVNKQIRFLWSLVGLTRILLIGFKWPSCNWSPTSANGMLVDLLSNIMHKQFIQSFNGPLTTLQQNKRIRTLHFFLQWQKSFAYLPPAISSSLPSSFFVYNWKPPRLKVMNHHKIWPLEEHVGHDILR